MVFMLNLGVFSLIEGHRLYLIGGRMVYIALARHKAGERAAPAVVVGGRPLLPDDLVALGGLEVAQGFGDGEASPTRVAEPVVAG